MMTGRRLIVCLILVFALSFQASAAAPLPRLYGDGWHGQTPCPCSPGCAGEPLPEGMGRTDP